MSVALDVLDILDVDEASPRKTILDREALLAKTEKKKNTRSNAPPKRPDHVPREVWGLQSTLNTDIAPLMPTDDTPIYKQPKAVIGVGRVRRWYWTPFTNSARQDGLVLHHWRREKPDSEAHEDYHFARYNKHVTIPEYTPEEYDTLLKDPKWSEEKTAHLMDLARRFDLRFIHMRDRWDSEKFPGRPSIEDLKERYYGILYQLDKVRGTKLSQNLRYDAAHERLRKQQLSLLYGRTKDQVEEEQRLVQELRKIEARRRERERKKQDLQKLISLADSLTRDLDGMEPSSVGIDSGPDNLASSSSATAGAFFQSALNTTSVPSTPTGSTFQRKRVGGSGLANSSSTNLSGLVYNQSTGDSSASLVAGGSLPSSSNDLSTVLGSASNVANTALTANYVINFLDATKNPGVHLRSQKMKLPSNLGQKKIRIIENFLAHLQIDPNPPATAEIVDAYNNLRSKILLLYDLRLAMLHCDYELQSARLRLEAFAPNQPLPQELMNIPTTESSDAAHNLIDPSILAALRVADSKRPILPRHSLGVAGTLAAAAGTLGLNAATSQSTAAEKSEQKHPATSTSTTTTTTTSSSSSTTTAASSASSSSMLGSTSNTGHSVDSHSAMNTDPSVGGGSLGQNMDSPTLSDHANSDGFNNFQRRRRAAALEQGRVLKKLKIKGQLVD